MEKQPENRNLRIKNEQQTKNKKERKQPTKQTKIIEWLESKNKGITKDRKIEEKAINKLED